MLSFLIKIMGSVSLSTSFFEHCLGVITMLGDRVFHFLQHILDMYSLEGGTFFLKNNQNLIRVSNNSCPRFIEFIQSLYSMKAINMNVFHMTILRSWLLGVPWIQD